MKGSGKQGNIKDSTSSTRRDGALRVNKSTGDGNQQVGPSQMGNSSRIKYATGSGSYPSDRSKFPIGSSAPENTQEIRETGPKTRTNRDFAP